MIGTVSIPLGPVMIDVAGFTLTDEERKRLCHPLVGGIILFRRNFECVDQLRTLVAEIRSLRSPALLVAVDHEGGRVQRLISGFTRLPAMATLGQLWQHNADEARSKAQTVGYVLATELRACGIDFSFTPVLDLDWGRCAVIGNRSFSRDPAVVSDLAIALQQGLANGGMGCCGKHFPGHGWVEGDSHQVIPKDERSLEQLRSDDDLQPFARLIRNGMESIMPAHVIYPAVDEKPAGFSLVWLKAILRGELRFDGLIFSDDLCMEGAAGEGNITARAQAAFQAGCDVVLVCNRPDLTDQLLNELEHPPLPWLARRLEKMRGEKEPIEWQTLMVSAEFNLAQQIVTALAEQDGNILKWPEVGESH